MDKKLKIGVIGGGNMGAAIIAGIYKKYSVNVCELDQKKCQSLKKKYKVNVCDLRTLMDQTEIILLAVKPQVFDEVLASVKTVMVKEKTFISIAAGITTKYIEQKLGGRAKVIRTMPNLPAQIQQGLTGICKGKYATDKEITIAKNIFECIGNVVVVEEKFIDAITAVSGSGPAYLFLFIENYIKAAKALGFSEQVAQQLVLKTVKGSLGLLEESKEAPAELRKRVTSKGGTTFAALQVLMSKEVNFDKVFIAALRAAKKRAKELSK